MNKISTIDLWSMDDTPAGILVPAIYDEFLANGVPLYDNVYIYKNADVSYMLDEKLVNSYQHVVLFLAGKQPVRIVFLRNCNLDHVVKEAFADKCLPNETSLNDLIKNKKMVVRSVDLAQKVHDIEIDKQLGSCDRIKLLVSMLDGAITADGTGEKMTVGNDLEFDPSFSLVIKVDLKDFDVEIKHKGVFKFKTDPKRWIILQDI